MEDHDKKSKDHLQNMELKEIHKVWGQTEADVIKSFLENAGIPCYFQGRILHSIYPFSVNGLGEIKILVPDKDYEIAKKLLENLEKKAPL